MDWFLELLAKFRSDEDAKEAISVEGLYPYEMPDTLSTEVFQELYDETADSRYRRTREMYGGGPQEDPEEWLRPYLDTLTAFIQNDNPDQEMFKLMEEDELIRTLRKEPLNQWGRDMAGDLAPNAFRGTYGRYPYGRIRSGVYIRPQDLYGLTFDEQLQRNYEGQDNQEQVTGTLTHEAIHHLDYIEGLRYQEDIPNPEFINRHGPTALSANTLEGAITILRGLESGDTVNIEPLVEELVEDYPSRYSEAPAILGEWRRLNPPDLDPVQAKKALEFAAGRSPFKYDITLVEEEESIASKILNLFGFGGNR